MVHEVQSVAGDRYIQDKYGFDLIFIRDWRLYMLDINRKIITLRRDNQS